MMNQANNSYQSTFKPCTYSFRELALEYFPNNTPTSASKAFRRLITHCKGLPEFLAGKGFTPGCKTLSPIIVQGIIEYLGEP